ncbi:MAG: SDR family oxidoreductase [Acidobacteriota bacterium]|nr:SDR family oxidoreductase [Acidobacteriota bacterium]
MSGATLLTGATGFLGMNVLAQLIDRGDEEIVVLIRADDDADAERRMQGVLGRLYDEPPAAAAHVRALRGDLLAPALGLSAEQRAPLISTVDRIVHCAASISFGLPLREAREINVGGVGRVIELARQIASGGTLRRLVHVSTAYVGGRHDGVFGEADLDVGQEFRNTYERSKHEGERLLGEAEDLPSLVLRPSMVVGHRASGWTPAFNVIYWPIRAFERGLLSEVPAEADSIVDFVPVDYVTEAIVALLDDPDAHGTYHLVAGEQAMRAGELVALSSSLLGSAPARLVPPDPAPRARHPADAYASYFDVRCTFGDARAREALERRGIVKADPREFLGRLIDYAQRTRWGKRPLSRQAAMAGVGALSASPPVGAESMSAASARKAHRATPRRRAVAR